MTTDQRPGRHRDHENLAQLRANRSVTPGVTFLDRALFAEPCTPATAPAAGNEWKLTTDWYHGVWHPDVTAEDISEFETPPAWYMTAGIRKTRRRWSSVTLAFAAIMIVMFATVPPLWTPWPFAIALLLGVCLRAFAEQQIIRAMRREARIWLESRARLLDKVVTREEVASEHQGDLLVAAVHASTPKTRQAVWTIAVCLRSLRPLEESWLRYSDLMENTYLHSTPAQKLGAHLNEVERQMIDLWSTIRGCLATLAAANGQPRPSKSP